LAALLVLLSAACGIWYLATDSEKKINELVPLITGEDQVRRLTHVILGSSLLVLTLVLAGIARWSPRKRGLLTIVTALLVLVAAAQIWMGVLLLYDSPEGRPFRFNDRDETTEA
jgi:hypothetical protein